jgi:hypothetical protein
LRNISATQALALDEYRNARFHSGREGQDAIDHDRFKMRGSSSLSLRFSFMILSRKSSTFLPIMLWGVGGFATKGAEAVLRAFGTVALVTGRLSSS